MRSSLFSHSPCPVAAQQRRRHAHRIRSFSMACMMLPSSFSPSAPSPSLRTWICFSNRFRFAKVVTNLLQHTLFSGLVWKFSNNIPSILFPSIVTVFFTPYFAATILTIGWEGLIGNVFWLIGQSSELFGNTGNFECLETLNFISNFDYNP